MQRCNLRICKVVRLDGRPLWKWWSSCGSSSSRGRRDVRAGGVRASGFPFLRLLLGRRDRRWLRRDWLARRRRDGGVGSTDGVTGTSTGSYQYHVIWTLWLRDRRFAVRVVVVDAIAR